MTDRYEQIRQALEMGPTQGPWRVNTSGVGVKGGKVELTEFYVYNPAIVDDVAIAADIIDPTTCKPSEANARLIAACDPDTIRALMAERDALAAAFEAAREDSERWRALRELDGGEIYALLGNCDGIHPEQADAAIDAAMAEKGGK